MLNDLKYWQACRLLDQINVGQKSAGVRQILAWNLDYKIDPISQRDNRHDYGTSWLEKQLN